MLIIYTFLFLTLFSLHSCNNESIVTNYTIESTTTTKTVPLSTPKPQVLLLSGENAEASNTTEITAQSPANNETAVIKDPTEQMINSVMKMPGAQKAFGWVVENTPLQTGKSFNSVILTNLNTLHKAFIKKEIGENCTSDGDCVIQETSCVNELCQCKDGYVSAADRHQCLTNAKEFGDKCVEDAQCFAGLNLTEGDVKCISMRCVCGRDRIFIDGKCIKSISLGDKCESDKDCLTVGSHCLSEVCACPVDKIPTFDNLKCLPALKNVSKGCVEDEQCQQNMGDNSLCDNGKCVCKIHTHFNSTYCLPDLKLGEECAAKADCAVDYETTNRRDCIEQRCACISGLVQLTGEDVCTSFANIQISRNSLIYILVLLFFMLRNC